MPPTPVLRSALKPLRRSFYNRSARIVAPELLGHWLTRRTPEGISGGPIVEVEAYLCDDPACHASTRRTPRNEVMFGPPGKAYVYYIYGAYYCVNAVCMPEGTAEAILIRAIEPKLGVETMVSRRPAKLHNLTTGPGKLCLAMDIDTRLNGTDLCNTVGPLMIARDPDPAWTSEHLGPVRVSPRIGITKAVDMPLRFYLQKSTFLSRPHGRV
jgi:DNA-3-methyladenine glycosylase